MRFDPPVPSAVSPPSGAAMIVGAIMLDSRRSGVQAWKPPGMQVFLAQHVVEHEAASLDDMPVALAVGDAHSGCVAIRVDHADMRGAAIGGRMAGERGDLRYDIGLGRAPSCRLSSSRRAPRSHRAMIRASRAASGARRLLLRKAPAPTRSAARSPPGPGSATADGRDGSIPAARAGRPDSRADPQPSGARQTLQIAPSSPGQRPSTK